MERDGGEEGLGGGGGIARALTLAIALIGALAPGLASAGADQNVPISPSCRVPDIYLKLQTSLNRTERLADRARPVRILVYGPAIGGPNLSPKKRTRLEHELERRMPKVQFTLIDEGHPSRLATDDFDQMRTDVARAEPDLVLWQVGTPDAIAAADSQAFGETLDRAAHWLKSQKIDFVLIDPPFDPRVKHERLYWKIVGKIGEVSDENGFNVFRRYATMQYLETKGPAAAGTFPPPDRRACMPELLAEAIVRAVTR